MVGTELVVSPNTVERLNKWKKDIRENYRPFLTVRDVNKVGRRHWLYCLVQQREVHLLSDGEFRAYQILVAQSENTSVMEQYALDLDVTMEIAKRLQILHPRVFKTGKASVMTTDFLVEQVKNGMRRRIAYSFKYANQIYDDQNEPLPKAWRTWQKFELERQYWNQHGVEYRLITEKHATKEHCWNLMYCESQRELKVTGEVLNTFIDTVYHVWSRAQKQQLQQLCSTVAHLIGVSQGYAMKLFKFAVYHSYLPLSHTACLRQFRSIELLPFE